MLFFSKKKRAIKKIEESINILEDKKNLLELDYKRLEKIASVNEEYVQEFDLLKALYEQIAIKENNSLAGRRETLLNRFGSPKLNKDIYDYAKQYEKDLLVYHKKINDVFDRFEKIFEPGIPLREKSVTLKETYREVLNEFDTYKTSLDLCADSLNMYLEGIECNFERFENFVNTAFYKEAEEVLSRIENDVLSIHGRIPKLAEYNVLVSKSLPEQLDELLNKEVQLSFSGYFISHLKIKELSTDIYSMLDEIKKNFARLYFKGFEDQYNEIEEKLTLVNNALEEEVSCKINFEENYQTVVKMAQVVESDFIKIKRQYNDAKQYYFIDDIIEQRFVKFQSSAAKLSDKKRDFEGFVFSNSRNPYSFMVKKMNTIRTESEEIATESEFFTSYFIDLKKYAEEIYVKEKELSAKLVNAIGNIRKNNNLEIIDFYQSKIDNAFSDLKVVREHLRIVPIKISLIKEHFAAVANNVDTLCKLLEQRQQEATLALQAIMFANQLRSEFNEVERVLQSAEEKYRLQQYKETAEMVISILKEYHPVAYETLGGK